MVRRVRPDKSMYAKTFIVSFLFEMTILLSVNGFSIADAFIFRWCATQNPKSSGQYLKEKYFHLHSIEIIIKIKSNIVNVIQTPAIDYKTRLQA